MARIVLENVSKSFAAPDGATRPAVDGVTLAIADRELVTLVGPSGSGKTTLLRLIAGLETPDYGSISFAGTNVTWSKPKERDVAFVFQSHALFPHFTAGENLAFGLKLRNVTGPEISARVKEVASMLGVDHCLDRHPAKLSGGERQRIALGRALIREPRILLLDEPFANLDEPLRVQFRSEVLRWRERFATSIIWVTHDQNEALAMGDRVAIIRNGALQQFASPREVYERPANRFVATFVGTPAMNLFHGTIMQRESRLVFCGTESDDITPPTFLLELGGARADWFGANVGRRILLGVRPEHVTITSDADAESSKQSMAARIDSASFLGTRFQCEASIAGRPVTFFAAPDQTVKNGTAIALKFNLHHARIFDAATGVAIF